MRIGDYRVDQRVVESDGVLRDGQPPPHPRDLGADSLQWRPGVLRLAKTNAVIAAELAKWHQGEISWEGAVNRALAVLAEAVAGWEERAMREYGQSPVRKVAESFCYPSPVDLTAWSERGPGPWQCPDCGGPKSIQESLCGECAAEKNLAPSEPENALGISAEMAQKIRDA